MPAEIPAEFQSTLVVRVSHDDIVIYANSAMAAYLRSRKEVLIGCSLETLAQRVKGEIKSCFQRFDVARPAHHLVTDEGGRVFEARTYRDGGVLDILLDEVTTLKAVHRDLDSMSGVSVDSLNEDELRTIRQPERRFLTVMLSRLEGASDLAERLPAGEARIAMNLFSEEASDVVLANGGSVFPMSVDELLGIHGAPRYFADHALRALRSACAQGERFSELRSVFHREGKELPFVQCGIWSGEAFVGTFGSSSAMRYSAMGRAVEMASRLARLARPGEVLVSETTLQSLRENLPAGWQAVKAENENPPNLSDFHWAGEEVVPLPDDCKRVVWLLGPGVVKDVTAAEFYLEYLWALVPAGGGEAVPVLRALRPSAIGDSVQLQDDNVVQKSFEQILGKYRLVSEIGAGGMGKVWKGMDRLGNTVAIKVLHGHETTSELLLKRFRREAQIMARLHHRNICRIFEMSEFEGMQFIVMEFVDGMTLAHLLQHYRDVESGSAASSDLRSIIQAIRTRAPSEDDAARQPHISSTSRILPVAQTLSIMLKVCEAVQFAHEHGVLHRDLKPGNILLREDGDPLVADFGLAKVHGEDAGQSLSLSGHVVGTLQNMAPEQAESSKDVDERADVYSLGTILYLMLTGKRHFKTSGNLVVDIQKLRVLEPVPLRKLNPALDHDLEIIVLKALRTHPAERYRSVSALASDIDRYRRGESISARPVTVFNLAGKAIKRHRAIAALAGLFFLVLFAGGAFSIWKIQERAVAAEKAGREADEQRMSAQRAADLAETSGKALEKALQATIKERDDKERALKDLDDKTKDSQAILAKNESLKGSLAGKAEEIIRLQEDLGARDKKIAGMEKSPVASAGGTEELKSQIRELEGRISNQPKPDLTPAREMAAAEVYTNFAIENLRNVLDPSELWKLSREPFTVLARFSEGLDLACKALEKDYYYAPAWMIKGRYHLACMDVDRARQAFEMAANSPLLRKAEGKLPLPGLEDPRQMLEIAAKLQHPSGDPMRFASSLLQDSNSLDSQAVARVLRWMNGKPGLNTSASSGGAINLRNFPTSLRLIDFAADNGGASRIAVDAETSAGAVESLSIAGIKEISRFDGLKTVKPASLKIRGAEVIDWKSLSSLPLKSLDLEGCQIDMIPDTIPGFKDLRTLVLKETPIESLGFLKRMQSTIEKLDISKTKIRDLVPIDLCRNLSQLDASGLSIEKIGRFPSSLTDLTITPELIAPQVLKALRENRNITVLRQPGDPPDQCAQVFWDNYADRTSVRTR